MIDDPAFPIPEDDDTPFAEKLTGLKRGSQIGLTKREYMAVRIFCALGEHRWEAITDAVNFSLEATDQLLSALGSDV